MISTLFISSLHSEHTDLRSRIYRSFGDAVWVAEHTRRDLCSTGVADLEIVDACADAIAQSHSVVCVLAGRRGTQIRAGDYLANATHFETEIFQAALLSKPLYVLISKGYDPDRSLIELLSVLRASIQNENWIDRLSDDEILEKIDRLNRRRLWFQGTKYLSLLRSNFYQARTKANQSNRLTDFFAGDHLCRPESSVSLDVVHHILTTFESSPDYHKQLSRMYIALRELMGYPLENEELLPLRNTLLNHWVSAASWYGLHGHIRSGALAAALSMAQIRKQMRDSRIKIDDERFLSHPGGQIASALFSIARGLSKPQKHAVIHDAMQHIEYSLSRSADGLDNLLAIRGSLYRIAGDLEKSIADYAHVLKFRNNIGAEPSKIGEAMSELGFGLLRQRKLWKGKALIEEGVEHMRQRPSSGFLIRGLKKLAVARLLTGHPIKAAEAFLEAREMARRTRMYDQLR